MVYRMDGLLALILWAIASQYRVLAGDDLFNSETAIFDVGATFFCISIQTHIIETSSWNIISD